MNHHRPLLNEYIVIINGCSVNLKKERNDSLSQFSLRTEIYIKALEKGYNQDKALMLSSIECNKIKYGVTYRSNVSV